jgi:flagellar hook-length control protein FliK
VPVEKPTDAAPPARPDDSAANDPLAQQADAATVPQPFAQHLATDARTTAATAQGTDRPLSQATLLAAQTTDPEAPVQSQQTARPAQDGTAAALRAQVADATPKDQLPPLGHMLSSRAAIVAQSETGAKMPSVPTDGAAGLKGGVVEPAAASLFGTAAQASMGGDAKAKGGQAKLGNSNANGNGQGANGAQAGQAAGQAVQQATAATTQQQQLLATQMSANANGGAQSESPAPLPSRSETLSLPASGQPAPQPGLRGPEAAAMPKPPAPVPPRFVTNQVAVQIQKAIGEGNDRISIQLKPAELGRVEVRLDVASDGRVTAVVTADRADTLDLLQRDARILQSSLQDAGLQADSNSLSFELKGNGLAFGHERRDGHAPSGSDDGIEGLTGDGAIAASSRPSIVTNDRVDIHV